MAITADSVTPVPVAVTAEPATADTTKPKDLQPSTPGLLPGVSAVVSLPPTAAAGVVLAKIVLAITAGSIAAFILYLIFMDITVASDVNSAYQQVYSVGPMGAEFNMVQSIEAVSTDLNKAKDPKFQLSADIIKKEEDIGASVAQLPSVLPAERSVLTTCAPPPTDQATRESAIDQCLNLLAQLKEGLLAEASSVAHSQAAADAVNKIGEQRQSLHTFWIQAAQLVLLNLLLPLLTALFGYIFGTQQSQRTSG